MKSSLLHRSLPLLLALMNGACTELLLGDKPFVLRDESGAQGGGGSGGDDGNTVTSSGGDSATGTTTSALVCEDGATACGGECVELESDPSNCGACGRSCQGAACQSGLCGVETVVSAVDDPRGIATDEVFVYWVTGGGLIQRSPKSGGPIFTLAEGQGSPGAIAVDATNVYWIDDETGNVVRMAKDGSGKSKSLLKSPGLMGLALDSNGLYLSRKVKKGTIQRIGKDGAGAMNIAKNQPSPTHIAVFGNQLMWAGQAEDDDDSNENDVPDGDEGMTGGYVHCAPTEGGDLVQLSIGEGQIVGLVAAGTTAVWADGQSYRIRARAIESGAIVTLVDGQHVRGMAAAGAQVYWTTEGGSVKRVSASGGPSQVLAIDIQEAGAAAVDDSHVYVTQKGAQGAIVRVAR